MYIINSIVQLQTNEVWKLYKLNQVFLFTNVIRGKNSLLRLEERVSRLTEYFAVMQILSGSYLQYLNAGLQLKDLAMTQNVVIVRFSVPGHLSLFEIYT